MKKLKIIITLIILIIIICIILLFTLLKKNEETKILTEEYDKYVEGQATPNLIINGLKPKKVNNENIYFTLENCIQAYINACTVQNKEAIYGILSKEFIENKDITINNLFEKINTNFNNGELNIIELYELAGVQSSYYEMKCKIDKSEYYFHINLDSATQTFDVQECDKSQYEEAIQKAAQTEEEQERKIEANNYNKVKYSTLSQEEIAKVYLLDYVQNALYNTQKAYSTLNKQYRDIRFKTYEKFEEYVNENKPTLQGLDANNRKQYSDFNSYEEYENYMKNLNIIELAQYAVENNDSYKEYTCVDEYDNYYIFKVYNAMEYEVTLDNYTIETDQFKSDYNNLSAQRKVMVNIDKYIKMLNTKDYETAYNKLDETFKKNNFSTLEKYIKYIKNNFYEYNKIEFTELSEQGDIYLYTVKITDNTVAKSKEITKTFVMQLKEGTDFVMSFSAN